MEMWNFLPIRILFLFWILGLKGVKSGPVAPVTKISTVLELFNPISLVKFFEFNDRGWNISGECIRDMFWYLEAIEQDYSWPIKLNDASGRYGGGFLAGTQHRLVDRRLCDGLNEDTREFYKNVQGNIANITKIVPYPVQPVMAIYEATKLGLKQKIHYSVCFSRSCSERELWHVFEYNPILGFGSSAVENISLTNIRVLKDSLGIDIYSPNILYLIFSTSLFLGLIFYSGLMGTWNKKARSSKRKVINSNTVLFFDVILTFFSSFAPKRLFRELRVDYGSKPFLHELRVLCLFIITFSQTIRMFLVVSGSEFAASHPILWKWSEISSSYSWDLLYFLVGFYLAFHINGLMKALSSNKIDERFNLHGENFHHFGIVFFVQLMRIFMPYMIIICLAQSVGDILHNWTQLDVPSVDHESCYSNGWRNVLFLDQFSAITERCAPWTWFISVEMYCSALVILLIMLTRRTPNFGMIVSSSFFLCSILLSIFLDQRPGLMTTDELEQDIRMFNSVHATPWIFIGPFLIGRYLGELCFQTKCKPRIGETINILGWILAFLILAIIISGRIAFGLFEDFQAIDVGFEGLSHSLFCMVVAWVVINKIILSNVNWKWTRPLSKLTLTCLFLHPIMLRLFVILLGSNSLPNADFFVIIVVHLGLFLLSLIAAGLLFLTFEAPFIVFKRRYGHKFILKQW